MTTQTNMPEDRLRAAVLGKAPFPVAEYPSLAAAAAKMPRDEAWRQYQFVADSPIRFEGRIAAKKYKAVALYHEGQHQRAEEMWRQAIQMEAALAEWEQRHGS